MLPPIGVLRKWTRREQVGRLLWALVYPLFQLSPRPYFWGWIRAMATAGRQLIDTKFHAQAVARDLEQLYRWAAGYDEMPQELMFDQ